MNSNGVMEAKGRQYTHNVTLRLNHCSSGKTVNITYHACAFVALGNQHAMRMFHIVICDLSGSKIFFHVSLTALFFSKKEIEYKMCVLIFSTSFVRNIYHSKNNLARYDQKFIFVLM